MYLHERENWTNFRWDASCLSLLLEEVSRKQGLLYGALGSVGFGSKLAAMAENMTREVVSSSEIEGVQLNLEQVRSSIARHLGLESIKFQAPSRYVESVVTVMMDAMKNSAQPLTKEKLCAWQAAFFPSSFSEGSEIETGVYRTHEEHIVSGFLGHEKIHYIAPAPERVPIEMAHFLEWFNTPQPVSFVIRSAIAQLWFVSIHPFEDGNGRIARILSDIMLARWDKSEFRFYNISSAINRDKGHYYDILERTQHGDGDITQWLMWYVKTLITSIDDAMSTVSRTLNKSVFWQRASGIALTERQTRMLNLFLDGYEAKITSKNWAELAKCSKDSALRDIRFLLDKDILRVEVPGAKRPSYALVYDPEDLTGLFTNAKVIQDSDSYYLTAIFKGSVPVRERLLNLDAKRYLDGTITLSYLLSKYCSYYR